MEQFLVEVGEELRELPLPKCHHWRREAVAASPSLDGRKSRSSRRRLGGVDA